MTSIRSNVTSLIQSAITSTATSLLLSSSSSSSSSSRMAKNVTSKFLPPSNSTILRTNSSFGNIPPRTHVTAGLEPNTVIGKSNGKLVVLGYPETSAPLIPPSPDPTFTGSTGPVVIRTEEVLIVGMVLVLWASAIALFFNRWGKIRMLEPYQPKFHEEEHRPSCPMVELTNTGIGLQQHRTSVAKFNGNSCLEQPLQPLYASSSGAVSLRAAGGSSISGASGGQRALLRTRQNSVFVGTGANNSACSSARAACSRKTRSAVDINCSPADCSQQQQQQQPSTSSGITTTTTTAIRGIRPLHGTTTAAAVAVSTTTAAAAAAATAQDRRCSYASNSGVTLPTRDRRSCSLYPPPINERRLSCIGECSPASYYRANRLGGLPYGGYRRDSFAPYYSRGGCLAAGNASTMVAARRTSCVLADRQSYREKKPSFNNVLAQVTTAPDRRPSSSMLRITNV